MITHKIKLYLPLYSTHNLSIITAVEVIVVPILTMTNQQKLMKTYDHYPK